ncbi:hypothetical protein [Mesorhizobium sp. M0800]|uniref:hypothetical protein n=1 Tax=Mesorhizobium sp. M0800 TaxID=2957000 RepID=UPI00333A19F1
MKSLAYRRSSTPRQQRGAQPIAGCSRSRIAAPANSEQLAFVDEFHPRCTPHPTESCLSLERGDTGQPMSFWISGGKLLRMRSDLRLRVFS